MCYYREIYERAIEVLPDNHARDMCLRYAALERRLGEIDRQLFFQYNYLLILE
jgi:pre-mRNA-splicing factor SYF1